MYPWLKWKRTHAVHLVIGWALCLFRVKFQSLSIKGSIWIRRDTLPRVAVHSVRCVQHLVEILVQPQILRCRFKSSLSKTKLWTLSTFLISNVRVVVKILWNRKKVIILHLLRPKFQEALVVSIILFLRKFSTIWMQHIHNQYKQSILNQLCDYCVKVIKVFS